MQAFSSWNWCRPKSRSLPMFLPSN